MFDRTIESRIVRFLRKGVFLDANLLLVYQIGLFSADLVERFKRTRTFSRRDFQLLHQLLGRFQRIVTTPTILAEVNSLASQLEGKLAERFRASFASQIHLLDERYQPSKEVCRHRYFANCGLSDAAIMSVSQEGLLVLTDDFRLGGYLETLGIEHLNFNHLRSYLLNA
jgi:hypothetical protein